MLRLVRTIIIAAVLLALAWWIGSLPGTLTAQSGDTTVETSVPVAILVAVVIVFLLTMLLRVISGMRRAPGGFFSWRGARRQRLGELATQRGIVALGAGDAAAAQAEATRARKLLGDTPLAVLLTAESARLAGNAEVAAAAFKKLTADKTMAFLGHRGLVRHHIDAGEHEVAHGHAQAAEASYPGSAWLKARRRDIAIKKSDWAAALGLTHHKPEVAALATAAAQGEENPRQAVKYAKQAVKAAPDLAPAVVAYADALRKTGRLRAARRALLAGWTAQPHPAIAQSFIAPFPTAIERAQIAADLVKARPGHPESELLLAQTSLDAKLTGEARRHAEAALAAGLNDGRAEAVLAALGDKLVVPNNAPSWVCGACFTRHADWQPVCPHCGKAGTLAWKTPPGTALA
jgi:HemY protein